MSEELTYQTDAFQNDAFQTTEAEPPEPPESEGSKNGICLGIGIGIR